MISLIKNGDNFKTSFGGTCLVYKEISSSEYNRLNALSPDDLEQEVNDTLTTTVVCGYGLYDYYLKHNIFSDKYYFVYERGTSCD